MKKVIAWFILILFIGIIVAALFYCIIIGGEPRAFTIAVVFLFGIAAIITWAIGTVLGL